MALSSREMEDLRHDNEYIYFNEKFSIPNTEEFRVLYGAKFLIRNRDVLCKYNEDKRDFEDISKFRDDEELKMLIYLNK